MGYCGWSDYNERNKIYHDTEWGIPVHDDRKMFEHLMLKKREVFRSCFDGFDYDRIAEYDNSVI